LLPFVDDTKERGNSCSSVGKRIVKRMQRFKIS
jgi:hypothetical protein